MQDRHLSDQLISAFAAGRLTTSEQRAVVLHLLSGCGHCRSVAREKWSLEILSGVTEGAAPPIERVMHRVKELGARLQEERRQAQEVLQKLGCQPSGRWATIVTNSRRCRTYAFCDLLIEEVYRQVFSEPQSALGLADTAVRLARQLEAHQYGTALLRDLQAKALAALGNARRVLADFSGAEEAFDAAGQVLSQGSGDPLDRARLLHLRALLCENQRRFQQASGLYDHAGAIYRRIGDRHLEGRVLGDKATLVSKSGDLEGAIRLRHDALNLLDPEREPRVFVAALHNLVHDLSQTGHANEALEKLPELARQHQALGDTLNLVRLRWMEGKILTELGRFDGAEAAFLSARGDLIERGLANDVALVSLDLATVYAEQGRTADVKRLAAEMLPIFQSLGIHREAIAAVLVFQRAAEMEAVTVGLIKELAAYFQRASKEPGLRFRAPAN